MASESKKFVLFEVAGATYALDSADVHHIEMLEHVTVVPNANPAIDGVVFSRGQVIPALNLRKRFGFAKASNDLRTRIVFVQLRERFVGLIVDTSREFISISSEMIRPIEQTLTGIHGNYLKAVANVGDRLILLIDLSSVLDLDNVAPAPANLPPTTNTSPEPLPAT